MMEANTAIKKKKLSYPKQEVSMLLQTSALTWVG